MIEVSINEANMREIESHLKELGTQIPGCISRAINRTLEMTRTEQVKKSKDKYTVNKNYLTSSMSLFKSSSGNLEGKIMSKGSVIGLDHFKLNPKSRVDGKMVKTAVENTGMKALPNSFIAYRDGRLGAFTRVNNSRFPIKRLKGPSAPQMLGRFSILGYLEEFANDKFNMRLEHELGRFIKWYKTQRVKFLNS